MLFSSMIWLALPMISLGSMGASDIAAEHYEAKGDWSPFAPDELQFIDFDEIVHEVIRKEESRKRQVTWWDLYGSHPFLKKRPEYSKYRVRVEVGDLKYGDLNITHSRRSWRKEPIRALMNSGNVSTVETLIGVFQQHTNYSWQVTNGLMLHQQTIGLETLFTGLGDEVKLVTIDISKDEIFRSSRKDAFHYSIDVPVQPETSAKFFWNITSWDIALDFSVDVKIDGYYAVYYTAPHNGHKIWFYPICGIRNDKLKHSGRSLVYRVKGIFRDKRDISISLVGNTSTRKKS